MKLKKWAIKVVGGIYKNLIQGDVKKQQETQKNNQLNKLEEIDKNLKDLLGFVRYLNQRGFKNRHERKTFWTKVAKGEPLFENVIEKLCNGYAKEMENIKNPKVQEQAKKDVKILEKQNVDKINQSI